MYLFLIDEPLFVCDVNKPVDAHLSKRSLVRQ